MTELAAAESAGCIKALLTLFTFHLPDGKQDRNRTQTLQIQADHFLERWCFMMKGTATYHSLRADEVRAGNQSMIFLTAQSKC